jgi:DNA-binding transcriptional LysR family regulator
MRIGAFSSFLSVVVAPALPDWRRQLPGVHFDVVEADREPLLRSLKAGEIDAAIIEFDDGETPKAPPRGVTEVPLLDEPWKLVVPAGPLISDVSDIGKLSLPWLGVEPGAAGAQAVLRLRRLAGMSQPTAHRYSATQTALSLVAAGEGMTLIPLLALHGIPMEGVDTLDVAGLGTRRIVLRSYFRGKQADSLTAAVTTLLRDAASEL